MRTSEIITTTLILLALAIRLYRVFEIIKPANCHADQLADAAYFTPCDNKERYLKNAPAFVNYTLPCKNTTISNAGKMTLCLWNTVSAGRGFDFWLSIGAIIVLITPLYFAVSDFIVRLIAGLVIILSFDRVFLASPAWMLTSFVAIFLVDLIITLISELLDASVEVTNGNKGFSAFLLPWKRRKIRVKVQKASRAQR